MKAQPRFRFFPMPAHSLLLFVAWLVLNNTLAPGHLVLGALLAIVIPWLVAGLAAPQPAIKRYDLAGKYLLIVLYDIVVANIEVAIKVLGPVGKLRPGFVAVPLDFSGDSPNELLITLLASTISLTPGTVSAEVSQDRKWLYVHVLHLEDEQALITQIKQRYEGKLKEIFGC